MITHLLDGACLDAQDLKNRDIPVHSEGGLPLHAPSPLPRLLFLLPLLLRRVGSEEICDATPELFLFMSDTELSHCEQKGLTQCSLMS